MLKVYVDGGCHNNQNAELRKAYGSFKIGDEPTVRREYGNNTNQEAEYKSIINALTVIKNRFSTEDVEIYTDSQLIVGQLTQNWKCKAVNLVDFVNMAKNLMTPKIKIIKADRSVLVNILGH